MNDQDVRRIIREELRLSQTKTSPIPYHLHNGIDSPSLNITTPIGSTYGGVVSSSSSAGAYFPSGWSVSNNTTGICTITHNLGTTNYAVVVLPEAGDTVCNVQSKTSTKFQIRCDLNATTPTNTTFDFVVQLNT